MAKECFGLKKVDAVKFRECAECPAFEPCTRSIYLQEARVVDMIARLLGFAIGAFGVVLALVKMGDLPVGAPWLLLGSVVYLLSVYYASREYMQRNSEEKAEAVAGADAPPAKIAAVAAHP